MKKYTIEEMREKNIIYDKNAVEDFLIWLEEQEESKEECTMKGRMAQCSKGSCFHNGNNLKEEINLPNNSIEELIKKDVGNFYRRIWRKY